VALCFYRLRGGGGGIHLAISDCILIAFWSWPWPSRSNSFTIIHATTNQCGQCIHIYVMFDWFSGKRCKGQLSTGLSQSSCCIYTLYTLYVFSTCFLQYRKCIFQTSTSNNKYFPKPKISLCCVLYFNWDPVKHSGKFCLRFNFFSLGHVMEQKCCW